MTEPPNPVERIIAHLNAVDEADEIERLAALNAELRDALEKSVALQSHYAGLLNTYDGGQRLQFSSAEAWRARLARLAASRQRKAGSDPGKVSDG